MFVLVRLKVRVILFTAQFRTSCRSLPEQYEPFEVRRAVGCCNLFDFCLFVSEARANEVCIEARAERLIDRRKVNEKGKGNEKLGRRKGNQKESSKTMKRWTKQKAWLSLQLTRDPPSFPVCLDYTRNVLSTLSRYYRISTKCFLTFSFPSVASLRCCALLWMLFDTAAIAHHIFAVVVVVVLRRCLFRSISPIVPFIHVWKMCCVCNSDDISECREITKKSLLGTNILRYRLHVVCLAGSYIYDARTKPLKQMSKREKKRESFDSMDITVVSCLCSFLIYAIYLAFRWVPLARFSLCNQYASIHTNTERESTESLAITCNVNHISIVPSYMVHWYTRYEERVSRTNPNWFFGFSAELRIAFSSLCA